MTATRYGKLKFIIGGELKGPGKFSLSCSPYIVTTFTAPVDGVYRIKADYSVTASGKQRPYSEETTQLTSSLVSNAGTSDPAHTVVKNQSKRERSLRANELSEEVLEKILGFFVSKLVAPHVGPLGSAIAKFILEVVFEALLDSDETLEWGDSWRNQVTSDFVAEEGQNYLLQFSTVGGITGQSTTETGGFQSSIEAEYNLDQFVLKRIGGERKEHELIIEGAGSGGTYSFTVSGSLRGQELELNDTISTDFEDNRTARGGVEGGKRDLYYYTGEITEWHTTGGSLKLYRDGQRWYPYG